jgi:calcineurin-like phosphoesterase family protein
MRIKQPFDPDKFFITSDLHFYHDNIRRFCSRPFGTVEEMNSKLIENWNDCVKVDDDIIVAGDFIHSGNLVSIGSILEELNGRIWLVMGNHDQTNKFDRQIVRDSFDNRVYDTLSISVRDTDFPDDQMRFFISHYPHLYWERGAYHCHGHIHSGPLSTASEVAPFHPLRIDIGVDAWDYKPVSYRELKQAFLKQIDLNDARKTVS